MLSQRRAGYLEDQKSGVLTTGAEGRGFTLSELKLAGIRRKEAKTIGIAVDTRRRSKSEEGQKLNVDRLKEYKTRLVVFPKKAGKPKSGDATVRPFPLVVPLMRTVTYLLCYRARTSPPTSPETPFPSPPLTSPRLPEPLPLRRRSSALSEPSESPDLTPETSASEPQGPRSSSPRSRPRRNRAGSSFRSSLASGVAVQELCMHDFTLASFWRFT